MKKMTLSVILFSIFIGLVGTGKTENQTNSWEKVLAEARKGGYKLIAPVEIKREYLKDPMALFLVDTRQEWEYQSQHIKGAVVLPAPPTWWYQYSPKARSEMRKALGPDKNKKVIFY